MPAPLPCPCGRAAGYAECCGALHAAFTAGQGLAAPTPEALMRSRYAAFVLDAFGPILKEYRCRNQWSTEVRVKDGEGFFTDPTPRGGLPSTVRATNQHWSPMSSPPNPKEFLTELTECTELGEEVSDREFFPFRNSVHSVNSVKIR